MEEHEKLADELESGADELDQRGSELDQEIDDTKQDWHAKVSDEQVPGAIAEGDAAPGGVDAYEDEQDRESE